VSPESVECAGADDVCRDPDTPRRTILMADVRENNNRLVLDLRSHDKKEFSISVIKDQSTGPNQIQQMHQIDDAVSDLAAQPDIFARLIGDKVPKDILESMKNLLASPSTCRKNSPEQDLLLAPMKV
jgi:hypothetical protein